MNVYPNPTTDFLMVENKSDIAKLDMVIYDLKGSVIYKNNLFSNSKIDVSNYEAGTYFLTLSDEQRIIETKTIFIQ